MYVCNVELLGYIYTRGTYARTRLHECCLFVLLAPGDDNTRYTERKRDIERERT